MTDIAGMEVELDLDNGQFTTKLTKSGAALQSFGKNVDGSAATLKKMERQIDSTGAAIQRMQKLALGFVGFDAFKAGVGGLIDAQKAMQQIEYGLVGALGSKKEAGDAYNYIAEQSEKLGLNLQVTATEFTKVTAAATAMNVPMSEQKKLFDALSRSQTVMHLSADQVKYSTMALSQMFGKGKIQAEELRRQLGEQIPGVVPRFQKAVMEMVKGTDLAGKSFDDLLRAGALNTDKFLPAMIQALQESGRGADEAAQGLNANLNRLSSAWFKLKADMSGGLFNDAVSASVRTLAANLQGLASAALAVSAVAAARYAGKSVDAGVDAGTAKVQRLAQEQRGLAMAAQAELAYNEAQIKTATGTIAENEALAVRSERMIVSGKASQVAALALQEQALSELKAAEATLAHQKTTLGLTANYRAQRKAELDLVVARGRLTASQTQYATATARVNLANERLLAQTIAITEAQVAQGLATKGVAAANQQVAASGVIASLGRAATGLKTAMLGLVGGPWGAALLAVGALGYAVNNVFEETKKFNAETKAQGIALSELTGEIKDATDAYGKLGAAKNLSKNIEQFIEGDAEARKAKAELTELLAKREDLNKAMSNRGGGGMLAGLEMDKLNNRIAELQALLPPATDALEGFRYKLGYGLTPAVDSLKESFDRLKAGGGLKGMLTGLFAGFETGVKSLDDAKAKVEELGRQSSSIAASQEKQLKTRGKTATQIAEQLRDERNAAARQQTNLTQQQLNEQLAAIKIEEDAHIATARKIDAIKTDKKSETEAARLAKQAAKEHEDQVTSLTDRIAHQNEVDQESLELNSKLLPAEKLRAAALAEFASKKNHLTQLEQQAFLVQINQLALDERKKKANDEKIKQQQQLVALQEKLNNQLENHSMANADALAGMSGGSAEQERLKRLTDLHREYTSNVIALNKEAAQQKWDLDSKAFRDKKAALESGYADELSQEAKFQVDKAAMQADGMAGMKASLADFAEAANNNNENMKRVTSDAMSGITDSLTNLVTAGKAGFKDLFTSLLKEITRVLIAKQVAALAGFLMSLWGGSVGTAQIGNGTGGLGMELQSVPHANGGVFSSKGSVPLRAYSGGGVAKSPQLALFGEGRMPEAYVPLPDGRSIPVTMKGGGASSMQNSVSINVNVDNGGQSQSTTDGSSSAARQFGELLNAKVKDVMANEMRQGGLLWKMKHG